MDLDQQMALKVVSNIKPGHGKKLSRPGFIHYFPNNPIATVEAKIKQNFNRLLLWVSKIDVKRAESPLKLNFPERTPWSQPWEAVIIFSRAKATLPIKSTVILSFSRSSTVDDLTAINVDGLATDETRSIIPSQEYISLCQFHRLTRTI